MGYARSADTGAVAGIVVSWHATDATDVTDVTDATDVQFLTIVVLCTNVIAYNLGCLKRKIAPAKVRPY